MNKLKSALPLAVVLFLSACAATNNESATNQMVQKDEVIADPTSRHIMILGTYHFANPGLDLNNISVDDVLSARRQAELEALSQALAVYKPTAIFVEASTTAPYLDPDWKTYTEMDLTTDRNEVVQIAYRLASRLKLERVYAVDEQPSDNEPDYFPYDKVAELAAQQGKTNELNNISDASAFLSEMEEMQKTASIPELLALMNGERFPNDLYWNIIRFGEGEKQPGAELAAYWFMRNAKIFNKIDQVTQAGDRILVVFGAGHGNWLREISQKSEGYLLEPVIPYLQKAAKQLRD